MVIMMHIFPVMMSDIYMFYLYLYMIYLYYIYVPVSLSEGGGPPPYGWYPI